MRLDYYFLQKVNAYIFMSPDTIPNMLKHPVTKLAGLALLTTLVISCSKLPDNQGLDRIPSPISTTNADDNNNVIIGNKIEVKLNVHVGQNPECPQVEEMQVSDDGSSLPNIATLADGINVAYHCTIYDKGADNESQAYFFFNTPFLQTNDRANLQKIKELLSLAVQKTIEENAGNKTYRIVIQDPSNLQVVLTRKPDGTYYIDPEGFNTNMGIAFPEQDQKGIVIRP